MGKFKDRAGETLVMGNGLMATISEYRHCNDVDVSFLNGATFKGATYDNFKKGNVKCPMVIEDYGNFCKVCNVNVIVPCIFLIDKEDLIILGSDLWHMCGKYVSSAKRGLLHKVIMGVGQKITVDHKDGNTLDNRKSNLRICTPADNTRNRMISIRNTTGYKGVHKYRKNKFTASIKFNNKSYFLGVFDCKMDAAKAYNAKAKELFGEFAWLNSIKGGVIYFLRIANHHE